jgi:hypothetical protein
LGGGGCEDFCLIPSDGLIAEWATAVGVDAGGYAYVAGKASSFDFPLSDPIQTLRPNGNQYLPFVAKIDPRGGLVFSTAAGGGGGNYDGQANAVAVGVLGDAYIVGMAPWPALFPVTGGAFQTQPKSSTSKGSTTTGSPTFVLKLSPGIDAIRLSSGANPVSVTQPVVLTAAVAGSLAAEAITFKDGDTVLGTATAFEGTAELGVTLAAGIHRITATDSSGSQVSRPYLQVVTPELVCQ